LVINPLGLMDFARGFTQHARMVRESGKRIKADSGPALYEMLRFAPARNPHLV
jgi:hypothetical protein